MFTHRYSCAIKLVSLFLVMLTLGMGVNLAEEQKAPEKEATPKMQVTCPVMNGGIDKSLYVDAKGKRIYVCCSGCIDIVKKDPEAALKKLAELGETPFDIPIEQKECPVMGGAINKDLFYEYEGKKLYVCCQACLDTVKKDPAKYAEKIANQIKEDKEKEAEKNKNTEE